MTVAANIDSKPHDFKPFVNSAAQANNPTIVEVVDQEMGVGGSKSKDPLLCRR